uniref:Uncharacterized protein n=1 Tax=Octopus bimaculoides TaxID=37653 RepID=A0A0L8GZI6_OCTBM
MFAHLSFESLIPFLYSSILIGQKFPLKTLSLKAILSNFQFTTILNLAYLF